MNGIRMVSLDFPFGTDPFPFDGSCNGEAAKCAGGQAIRPADSRFP
jgi:hypothetical protein